MNNSTKIASIGVVGCAICCTAPLLAIVGAGTAMGVVTYWGPLALTVSLPLGGLLLLSHRRVGAGGRTFKISAARQCSCGSCTTEEKSDTPIACSLDASPFKTHTKQ